METLSLKRIDEEQYNELSELLESEFSSLIRTFFTDSEEKMKAIYLALETDNNRMGYEAAHNMKGASINLGANRLSGLCFEVQKKCSTQEILTAATLIDELATERKLLIAELEKRIK